MKAPRIVGLDLSLAATGICHSDGSTGTVKTRPADGDARLHTIAERVRLSVGGRLTGDLLRSPVADLVVIEDLPTHAKSAGITGMVHGAVRLILVEEDIRYALVTPATLKKYATGKGNCGKAAMATAAQKRMGRDFGDDDNECDAWWLWAAAMEHYRAPVVELPAAQRKALDVVAWPELVTR